MITTLSNQERFEMGYKSLLSDMYFSQLPSLPDPVSFIKKVSPESTFNETMRDTLFDLMKQNKEYKEFDVAPKN